MYVPFAAIIQFFFSRTPKCLGSYPWEYAYAKLGVIGVEGEFFGGKAASAWCWPRTLSSVEYNLPQSSWCAMGRLQFVADRLRTRLLGAFVRIPVCAGEFSLLQDIQSASGAHPVSRLEDTTSSATGGVKLPTHHLREEWVELYLHPLYVPQWCGA
jgi:hypothetical protein